LVSDLRSKRRTYSANILGLVVAALATDIFEIKGAADVRVEVGSITISGVQTTAGQVVAQLIRRSTANTTGTSTAPAAIKHDAADAAAAATLKAYTVNPGALGTSAGTVRALRVPIGVATGAVAPVTLEFGAGGKPIVLASATESLCLNLNGVTVTGGTLDINIEWTESTVEA